MKRTHPAISELKNLYFSETPFVNLMKKRIYHVLLIASNYDSFILEGDSRIEEQLFNEYVSLSLRYPPHIIQANTEEEAYEILERENIDLIISMLSMGKSEIFDSAKRLKSKYPGIPIVVLTSFSREVSLVVAREDLSAIDHVFSWLGDADLLLAIIKLVEDKMNLEHDIAEVGVQAILLVENSIRFYSSYLPNIYKIIFNQSREFMTEGLNEHQQMLRMRGRPKILLATTYEEAVDYYRRYKNNLLGVITDTSYSRNGAEDPEAGVRLIEKIKEEDDYTPLLMQSSDAGNAEIARRLNVGFIHKMSKTLSLELRNYIKEHFAFGDFVFVDPGTGQEIMRAPDLKSLQEVIMEVPDGSLHYHIFRNHISKWLYARALFPLANFFRDLRPEDFKDLGETRRFIFEAIAVFRINKARGIIAEFNRDRFDQYLSFSRLGTGSIGGKARGLAFLDSLLKRNNLIHHWPGVVVTIPRTLVLGADIFDDFMQHNDLYQVALSHIPDEQILERFVQASLPHTVKEDLIAFMHVVKRPIAIRSSSMLEDSYFQPFAGVYATYMIPNNPEDERQTLQDLSAAIKSVYASTFYRDSKAYMEATSNVIDEEKMAIVLQEVAGSQHGEVYYPSVSGVARSINFYPLGQEKMQEGIANIAVGLGKYIVDGGMALRFSPRFPKKILQLSTPDLALRETQKKFFALDLRKGSFVASTDECANLLRLSIDELHQAPALRHLVSSYDSISQMLYDGQSTSGRRIISFANILKFNVFPLADLLKTILEIGQREMGKPVEIEFAFDLNGSDDEDVNFYLLQIRPIVDARDSANVTLSDLDPGNTVITARSTLGNGILRTVKDVIYVKPQNFDPARNVETVDIISSLNQKLQSEDRPYILIGPGRWGSSDPWLGIPVKWSQISGARLIVESGLKNYRIDPSQGTHFFQNLTSFRVGYFTINPFMNDGSYDLNFLDAQPALYEDDILRHVRFESPLNILIDGKRNKGAVLKPDTEVPKPHVQ